MYATLPPDGVKQMAGHDPVHTSGVRPGAARTLPLLRPLDVDVDLAGILRPTDAPVEGPVVDAQPPGGHPVDPGDLAVIRAGERVAGNVPVGRVVRLVDRAGVAADRDADPLDPAGRGNRGRGVGALFLNGNAGGAPVG